METTPVPFNKNSQVRKERRSKLLVVWLLVFLVVMAGIVGFLRKQSFQITDIEIVGTESLGAEALHDFAQSHIDGNYVWVIPKSNVLLFSKQKLRREILETFPAIDNASIAFRDTNHITVTVSEKKPAYVWCGNGTCFFTDDAGMRYQESAVFSDGVYIIMTGGNTSGAILKTRVADDAVFAQAKELIETLGAFPMTILAVDFGDDITIRFDAINGSLVNPQAKLLVSYGATTQSLVETLQLLMADKSFQKQVTTVGSSLDYIDLRIDGKIYYKFGKEVVSSE